MQVGYMQQSKIAFIALAREILSLSLALECSGNVSSAYTWRCQDEPSFNPLQPTYVCGLNPGSTRIRQNRVECGRAQPGLNPGSRASADMPLVSMKCIHDYHGTNNTRLSVCAALVTVVLLCMQQRRLTSK